jgi:hypothetical protein
MKRFWGAVAAALLIAAPMTGADARAGISKAEIAAALSSEGYAVRDFRANMLAVTVGGYTVIVGVDGADGDVTYLTWLTNVSIDQLGHDFLTRFNSEVKFGRAYVDRDGDIAIQMDRNSSGGVSIANIKSDFDVFLLLVSKFLSDVEKRASA